MPLHERRVIQSDLAPDRRSPLELRLLERGEYGAVAEAYETSALIALIDPALTRRERNSRWHDQMTSAAVLRGRV